MVVVSFRAHVDERTGGDTKLELSAVESGVENLDEMGRSVRSTALPSRLGSAAALGGGMR